jgi:hypothetical protein
MGSIVPGYLVNMCRFWCVKQGQSYSDGRACTCTPYTHKQQYASHTSRLLCGELFTINTTFTPFVMEHGTPWWEHRWRLSRQLVCKSPSVLRVWDMESILLRRLHRIVRSQIFRIGYIFINLAEGANNNNNNNNNNNLERSWLPSPVATDIHGTFKEDVSDGITLYIILWYLKENLIHCNVCWVTVLTQWFNIFDSSPHSWRNGQIKPFKDQINSWQWLNDTQIAGFFPNRQTNKKTKCNVNCI